VYAIPGTEIEVVMERETLTCKVLKVSSSDGLIVLELKE